MTDRQTDGQTDTKRHQRPRLCTASRGNNFWTNKYLMSCTVLLAPGSIYQQQRQRIICTYLCTVHSRKNHVVLARSHLAPQKDAIRLVENLSITTFSCFRLPYVDMMLISVARYFFENKTITQAIGLPSRTHVYVQFFLVNLFAC